MIFEKAESESTVFSSDGRRYMYGIVLYELPVFCSEPEGFRFIDAFQQEMYGREEEGTSVCFDMFVGLSKVYECGDSEKGSSNWEKNSKCSLRFQWVMSMVCFMDMSESFLIEEIPRESEMDVHRIDGIVGDEECVLVSRSVVYMVYVHIKTAVLQEEVDVGVANGIVA